MVKKRYCSCGAFVVLLQQVKKTKRKKMKIFNSLVLTFFGSIVLDIRQTTSSENSFTRLTN